LQQPRETGADTANSIHNMVGNNPLTLIALGAGIAQGGVGRGLALAAPALNIERQQRQHAAVQSATYYALRSAGLQHGEALAGALHPEVLKAIARSRLATPAVPQAMSSVRLIDPEMTEGSTPRASRGQETQNSADGAAFGKNAVALNVAIGRLGSLMEAYKNNSTPATTGVQPLSGERTGSDPGEQDVSRNTGLQQQAVTQEMEKMLRGAGIGDEQLRDWKNAVSKADSRAQVQDALAGALGLLDSRMQELALDYKTRTGRDGPQLVYPKSELVLRSLRELANPAKTGEQKR
jgi:hypothetical protein